jgi:hypothetical protein
MLQVFNGQRVYHFLRDQDYAARPAHLTRQEFDGLIETSSWLSTVGFVYHTLHTEHLRELWENLVVRLVEGKPRSRRRLGAKFARELNAIAKEKDYRLMPILGLPSEPSPAAAGEIGGS